MVSSESAQNLSAVPDEQPAVQQSRDEAVTRQDVEHRVEAVTRQEVAAGQADEALSKAAAASKDATPPADDRLMVALFGPPPTHQPLLKLPPEKPADEQLDSYPPEVIEKWRRRVFEDLTRSGEPAKRWRPLLVGSPEIDRVIARYLRHLIEHPGDHAEVDPVQVKRSLVDEIKATLGDKEASPSEDLPTKEVEYIKRLWTREQNTLRNKNGLASAYNNENRGYRLTVDRAAKIISNVRNRRSRINKKKRLSHGS